MIDLKINNAGDITSESAEPLAKITLRCKITEAPVVRLSFKTEINSKDFELGTSGVGPSLCLQMDTDIKDETDTVAACSGEDELKQRILLLTRGTPRLVRQKHEDITSTEVLKEVQAAILSKIRDILKDPHVEIRKTNYEGIFSWQNLSAYIYDGKKEIYNFKLEG